MPRGVARYAGWPAVTGADDNAGVITTFASLDGTTLVADVVAPPDAARGVVLVHGGGVDRHEAGFFDRLADGLGEAGIASLRFDFRGHGESGGTKEDLTLAGVANDVRSALQELGSSVERVSLLGASFSGGICASVAARHPDLVDRLVLFNPLLNYKKRFIDDKDYWHADRIDADAVELLNTNRYVEHSPTFRLGRALLNEVFWWDTLADLPRITAPTLIVHGTRDTFIPVESSRMAVRSMTGTVELLELEGAQHGIAMPDDPGYEHPQTRQWQSEITTIVARWVTV